MILPIKAQIITQKCNAVHSRHGSINFDLNFETVICQITGRCTVQNISATYGNEKAKNLEKRKVRSHNKVR